MGDYKRTRQGALAALLPYLYKLQVVRATTMCLPHVYSAVTVHPALTSMCPTCGSNVVYMLPDVIV